MIKIDVSKVGFKKIRTLEKPMFEDWIEKVNLENNWILKNWILKNWVSKNLTF